jgi:hypothetical protein
VDGVAMAYGLVVSARQRLDGFTLSQLQLILPRLGRAVKLTRGIGRGAGGQL